MEKAKMKQETTFPVGEILTADTPKNGQWMLGSSIGRGGFGEVYSASKLGTAAAQYAIKIEPVENETLLSECRFYRLKASEKSINAWTHKMKLKYLSIPKFIAFGCHEFQGSMYHFLVTDRFGENVHTHFRTAGYRFSDDTICYLALRILEGLEFLHEAKCIHADIKGSNIVTGLCHPERVYLIDYGLTQSFCVARNHRVYRVNPQSTPMGTPQFASIDAHDGASPSRRGDLEILGYCLLRWRCGKLPWEHWGCDVGTAKRRYKSNPAKLFEDSHCPHYLETYMTEVYRLGYKDKPSYSALRKPFLNALEDRDPASTLEWVLSPRPLKRPATPSGDLGKKMPKIEVPTMPPSHRRAAAFKKKSRTRGATNEVKILRRSPRALARVNYKM